MCDMKILCIGHAAYDITIPMKGFIKENTKNRVHELVKCGGGPACNAAYLLGKWGMETYFAGVVGNDVYGQNIIRELETVGVDTTYLQVVQGYETPNSFIIANTDTGSRTVMTYRSGTMHMSDVDIDFTPDVILLDGQEYEFSKKMLEKYPDAISIIDAGRPVFNVINLASMCDYVVCSHEFAQVVSGDTLDLTKPSSIVTLYGDLKDFFKKNIVITVEDKGAIYEKDNHVMLMPSLKMQAVDSTAAGDIFHGAFTYAIANGYKYDDVIKIGNVAGAISVTRVGGRYSIPTKEEMKKYIDDFK